MYIINFEPMKNKQELAPDIYCSKRAMKLGFCQKDKPINCVVRLSWDIRIQTDDDTHVVWNGI